MSVDIRSSDRRRYMNEIQAREKEIAAGLLKASQPESPKLQESDKRHRREIANSNERRRMQCINAGFSSLRALIPQLEGEKLSKAAILQHTTEFITSLEKEKRRLQLQVEHYMSQLSNMGSQGQDRAAAGADNFVACSPPPSKRKKRITESSDEGVGALSDESDEGSQVSERLQQENLSLRHQLETEHQRCQALEERNRQLESQICSLLRNEQSAAVHRVEELLPVKLESQSNPVQESLYNREVVEVVGSMESMPTPPREDTGGQLYPYQPPRPLSPTPDRGMAMESSTTTLMREVSATAQTHVLVESRPAPVHYDPSPLLRASLSPAVKPEGFPYPETSAPGVTFQSVSALEIEKNQDATASMGAGNSPQDQLVRTYQHRDHPRRRHRQQARLERQRAQQEEEEKRRKEEQEKEQQERILAPPLRLLPHPQAFRPSQNLENLVEAIRHIEGEAALCDPGQLYEEEHKLYEKRQALPNSSEESSSMSDPDELKSESSGRDSPFHQHHTYHQHLQQQQQHHNILSDRHKLQLSAASSPSLSSLSISSAPSDNEGVTHPVSVVSSNLSDYQSSSAFLRHHSPSLSTYYRPGVIVHKQ
ncbi:transcription factor ap-4-like [Plakobranchus ocellatus]|uniref:Transcription factor ap-4-like n=1 Tax=Plakobranchus ocellatus TaxID=259542 RepID=A0AAV3YI61_9GAST|nr:transcription factor ap-4-like [Plakobranchus ocellatus]